MMVIRVLKCAGKSESAPRNEGQSVLRFLLFEQRATSVRMCVVVFVLFPLLFASRVKCRNVNEVSHLQGYV